MIAVVDAGPLYAAADASDVDHRACAEVLQRTGLRLVIPVLVVAEVTYFLASRLGPRAEAAFLRDLDLFEVEAPLGEEWPEIAALVEEYADFPLGAVDASVVTLARRLGTHVIVTLDHRHFRALRTESGDAYTLLP